MKSVTPTLAALINNLTTGDRTAGFQYAHIYSIGLFGQQDNLMYALLDHAATPSTLPPGWMDFTVDGVPIATGVSFVGVNNGMQIVRFRWNGTSGAAGFPGSFAGFYFGLESSLVGPDGETAVAATTADTFDLSCFLRLAGGSLTNVTDIELGIDEYNNVNAFLAAPVGPNLRNQLSSGLARFTARLTPTNVNTVKIDAFLQLIFSPTSAIDLTLELALPSLQRENAIYLTDAPIDVLWNGHTYLANTVKMDSKANKRLAHWKRGLDVDQHWWSWRRA
jgi:hypothetical protein